MIFGNPDKFAIHCDIVDEWNDDFFWINGIYNIYINGKIINELHTSELRFNLANFTKDILSSLNLTSLSNKYIDNNLLSKECMLISSSEMEDYGIFIYFSFDKMNDFIFLNNKDHITSFKYERGYILEILYKLAKWKLDNSIL